MIRHAASTSNKASSDLVQQAQQESPSGLISVERWLEVYADENLIDAKLTQDGVKQCLVAAEHAK